MRVPNTKWAWHDQAMQRENHPEFLQPGEGLKKMARPAAAKASRQNLEKQKAEIEAKLLIAKTAERHLGENKSKKATVN